LPADDLGRKIIFVLLGLAIAVAVFILVARWGRMRQEERPPVVTEVPGETRTITVFYGSRDATSLVEETREITSSGRLEDEVGEAVNALLEKPQDDALVSAIPPGTKIERVYWVEDEETLYLDFNRALTANHPGGSVSEYFTIKVILKTISANFPQVSSVQLLVSGYPVETIAGHYGVSEPLDVRKWR
jgi:hypothetical protein